VQKVRHPASHHPAQRISCQLEQTESRLSFALVPLQASCLVAHSEPPFFWYKRVRWFYVVRFHAEDSHIEGKGIDRIDGYATGCRNMDSRRATESEVGCGVLKDKRK
jgi:hypothetical protein